MSQAAISCHVALCAITNRMGSDSRIRAFKRWHDVTPQEYRSRAAAQTER